MERQQTTRMTTTFQRSEDGLSWHEDAAGDTVRSLQLLFVGSTIANFEYWSEFVLRIQGNEGRQNGTSAREVWNGRRVPPMFCLRLRNRWWMGDRELWDSTVNQFPIKPAAGIPEETALQASAIVRLLGSTIVGLIVSELGNLEITFSNGEELYVSGAGGIWDEGWIFELPADDPDRERWSVVCDSGGIVYAKWPLPVGESR